MKNITLLVIFIFVIAFFNNSYAAKEIYNNQLTLGATPYDTNNKVITLQATASKVGAIRFNYSTEKMQASHNASDYFNLEDLTTITASVNQNQTDIATNTASISSIEADIISKFDTSTGHDHDGSDSKKVLGTNIDSTGATASQVLASDGAGNSVWITSSGAAGASEHLLLAENYGLSTTISASALNIAITQKDGSTAPTGGSPAKFGFITTGTATSGLNIRSLTSSASLTIPNGASLGCSDDTDCELHVYLMDNEGTLEPGFSRTYFPDGSFLGDSLQMTSSSATPYNIFTTTARSDLPTRYIGKVTAKENSGAWYSITKVENEIQRPLQIAIHQDQKASSTSGGDGAAGSWLLRPLNTLSFDGGFSIQQDSRAYIGPGTYLVEGYCTLYDNTYDQCRVVNEADSDAVLALGQSDFNARNSASQVTSKSEWHDIFTVTNNAVVEVQYYIASNAGSPDFGIGVSFGTNIFVTLKLTKLK